MGNQAVKEQVIVKNGVLPPQDIQFPTDIKKAVESDWKVELLLEEHPDYEGKVSIVKMTSKWGDTSPTYRLFSDFHDKKEQKELTKELVNKGVFYPDELPAFIKYVNCLKRAELITSNDRGYKQHILGTSELKNKAEADRVYHTIVEHVIENGSAFPAKGEYKDENDGVRFTDERDKAKYGEYSIAFEAKKLGELLEIKNKIKMNSILGELAIRGVLFPGSSENRKKVTLRQGNARHSYIFKIDESVLTKGGM
ncbi:hypothetical protein [Metabacillus sp. B2-18]|uniref:hypothetical protein n=1 Tax=Metabacillus sp. B2-18 TaxID=2897333 RepID=UPI001E441987|nr:hypothetical protein [Metabacillus sp. B2-18]UGB29972.1 hypothetical protein LPC09_19970 [Metabacillus sp. B2-18]